MAEKPKQPPESETKKFETVVSESKAYEFPTAQLPAVELVGRVRKPEEAGKCILLVPSGIPGIDQVPEIKTADVVALQQNRGQGPLILNGFPRFNYRSASL